MAGSLDEAHRLRVLERYHALDGEPLPDLEAVARLAAKICGVPNATVNLISAEHQHQVATAGFVGSLSPRGTAMCNVTIDEPHPVHVSDARLDPRFAHNPWVTAEQGGVVFYAASQLRTSDGACIGTLCVFDETRRELDAEQRRALDDLAEQVVALLELRREARTLRRSNEDLEAFTGRVAHDLRGPLSAVHGFLQLAANRFGDELGPKAATCVTSALAGAQRMEAMLSELLRFATAAGAVEPQEVALRPLVSDVLADLATELTDTEAQVAIDIAADLVVRTDPVLLRQVVQNLVANALRYHHPDRAPKVQIAASRGHGGWQLRVSDNGIGVPMEDRGRIFEVLTRGSNVGSTPGTGIGLATCARLTEALGGTIEVGDAPGGGAEFSLAFGSG